MEQQENEHMLLLENLKNLEFLPLSDAQWAKISKVHVANLETELEVRSDKGKNSEKTSNTLFC